MSPNVIGAFKSWLKSNVNIKLASDAAVLRMTCEGVTDYASLNDFDRESIEALSKACSKTIPAVAEDIANGIAAENEVPGANISSISIRRLVVALCMQQSTIHQLEGLYLLLICTTLMS